MSVARRPGPRRGDFLPMGKNCGDRQAPGRRATVAPGIRVRDRGSASHLFFG